MFTSNRPLRVNDVDALVILINHDGHICDNTDCPQRATADFLEALAGKLREMGPTARAQLWATLHHASADPARLPVRA